MAGAVEGIGIEVPVLSIRSFLLWHHHIRRPWAIIFFDLQSAHYRVLRGDSWWYDTQVPRQPSLTYSESWSSLVRPSLICAQAALKPNFPTSKPIHIFRRSVVDDLLTGSDRYMV